MAANRSVSNKPLSRKQRVLNRGYLYSRSDDAIKTPAVTLMDMDSAIIHYFEKVIRPFVIQYGERVPVPIIYGEVFTGSVVISAGIDTVQIEGTAE